MSSLYLVDHRENKVVNMDNVTSVDIEGSCIIATTTNNNRVLMYEGSNVRSVFYSFLTKLATDMEICQFPTE